MARTYRKNHTKRPHTKTIAKVVRSIMDKRVEVKHGSIRLNNSMTTVPTAINIIDYIRMGSKGDEREGNRLNLLSMMCRGMCVQADLPYNHCRVTLVETREALPINPVAGTYDASECFTDLGYCGPNSIFNYNVVKKVYWDKSAVLRQLVVSQPAGILFNKRVGFGKDGKKIVYDGDTGSLGESTRSFLYLVWMSDSILPTHPAFEACLYLRFTDQ